MKKIVVSLVSAALALSVMGSPVGAKPKTVFEDATGDAGNQDTGIPGFTEAGFDIVKGSIDKKGKDLIFTVEHAAAFPNFGAPPEGFRLLWHFFVGKDEYRFTIKSVDIGKPDPLSGPNGTERLGRVDTAGHFRLETWEEQPPVGNVSTPRYTPVEYLEGTWDPATASVSVTLPMSLVKAKKGTVIKGGTGAAAATSCQICWVPQYAERSLTPHTVIDSAAMATVYKIP